MKSSFGIIFAWPPKRTSRLSVINILFRNRNLEYFSRMRHLVNHVFMHIDVMLTFSLLYPFTIRLLFWQGVECLLNFIHQHLVNLRFVVYLMVCQLLTSLQSLLVINNVHLVNYFVKMLLNVLSKSSNMAKKLLAHGY